MTPRTSRDPRAPAPRIDKTNGTQETIADDAAETEDAGRDLAHGEGGSIEVPTRPGDVSKDD